MTNAEKSLRVLNGFKVLSDYLEDKAGNLTAVQVHGLELALLDCWASIDRRGQPERRVNRG